MAPFWILTNPYSRPVLAPNDLKYVAGFRSLHNAMAFAPENEKWGFKLVCHPTALCELRRKGLLGVCFEPGHEHKEKKVAFADLEATARKPVERR
jgi:hypothetical protein